MCVMVYIGSSVWPFTKQPPALLSCITYPGESNSFNLPSEQKFS